MRAFYHKCGLIWSGITITMVKLNDNKKGVYQFYFNEHDACFCVHICFGGLFATQSLKEIYRQGMESG